MRPASLLLSLSVAGLWALSLALYPHLPERIPVHFGADGTPDRHAARTLATWLLLPVLASAIAGGIGAALPRWIAHLAATGSPALNMPARRLFAALPPAARVRAVAPVLGALRFAAALVALLFGYIQVGSYRVAVGSWQRLPELPAFAAVAAILGVVLASIPASRRAVQREAAAANVTADAASPR